MADPTYQIAQYIATHDRDLLRRIIEQSQCDPDALTSWGDVYLMRGAVYKIGISHMMWNGFLS